MKKNYVMISVVAASSVFLLNAGGDIRGKAIDISDLSSAEVVKALFDGAECRGRAAKETLTIEEAKVELEKTCCSLKTLKGCYIPIDITAGEKIGSRQIDTRQFNAWNGAGKAERAIAALRSRMRSNKK